MIKCSCGDSNCPTSIEITSEGIWLVNKSKEITLMYLSPSTTAALIGELRTLGTKSQTPEEWVEEMKDKPCYKPAPPFYDFCNHMGHPDSGHSCDACVDEHQLSDCIE